MGASVEENAFSGRWKVGDFFAWAGRVATKKQQAENKYKLLLIKY